MTERPSSERLTAIRRSDEIHPSRGSLVGIGMWLAIGVYALYDFVVEGAGSNTPLAFIAVLLFMIPTALSHFELRSWLGRSGGSYRLIRTMERPELTFLTGWLYALGWAALSALLAKTFAGYAAGLIDILTGWQVPEMSLIGVLLVVFTLVNTLGRRPSWNWGMLLATTAIVAVGLLTFSLSRLAITQDAPTRYGTAPPGSDFYGAVALLVGAAWVTEITLRYGRRADARSSAIAVSAAPVLGALLALAAKWAEPSMPSLVTLAGIVSPFMEAATLAVGALVSALAWQILALLMLRAFSNIGSDGVMPEWLTRRQTRFDTPVVLIAAQVVLTLVLLAPLVFSRHASDWIPIVAQLAALAFLAVQLGVNVTAVVLANHPRALKRSVVLPVYPIIPALGIAACLILILGTQLVTLALGIGWLAMGVLLYWQSGRNRMRTTQMGVTVFQDTSARPALTSEFAVVVPVANPESAKNLVAFGAAAAKRFGGHVVLVQVIEVSEQLPLGAARSDAQRQLAALEEILQYAEALGARAEAVTRVARSVSQGILDTIIEENARLVVLGWHVEQRADGRWQMADLLRAVMESAACRVAICRGDWSGDIRRILVPLGGGPNAPRAAELGLALTAARNGTVTLLNVTRPDRTEEETTGQQVLEDALDQLDDSERLETRVVAAPSPMRGIREALRDHDAIMLGASDPGFFDSVSFDPLPLRLGDQIDKPLAVVRSSVGVSRVVARRAWHSLADVLPTLNAEEQRELYREMHDSAQSSVNYFVLIILSAMIATLGLLLNSVAVIIGAMLVAPLMGPIVATAAGIAFGNVRMLKQGAITTVQGSLLGVFIALFTTLVTPMVKPTSEIMARTSPNILDLMVALVSGAAGAYILARKEVGGALPGVAIAAALMPPLCVIGIGLALFDPDIYIGATLLFAANLAAIVFASALVFLLLGVRPPVRQQRERWLFQGLRISVVSLVLISIPLVFAFIQSVIQGQVTQTATAIVVGHVESWSRDETGDKVYYVKLIDLGVNLRALRTVDIEGTIHSSRIITAEEAKDLEEDLENALRPAVNLEIFTVLGTELSSGPGGVILVSGTETPPTIEAIVTPASTTDGELWQRLTEEPLLTPTATVTDTATIVATIAGTPTPEPTDTRPPAPATPDRGTPEDGGTPTSENTEAPPDETPTPEPEASAVPPDETPPDGTAATAR